MPELLPRIDIAVAGPLVSFLNQMAQIAAESGDFKVEQHFDCLGEAGFHIANFRCLKASAHRELGGQLIVRPDVVGRVLVEMRASRWDPDPPTRSAYCEAARAVMWPILQAYNRFAGIRHRFRISKAAADRLKLTRRSEALIHRFASLANKASLHPLDWRRFYALVREGRQRLTEEHIRQLLHDKGFSETSAEHLAEIYTHLWAFKLAR